MLSNAEKHETLTLLAPVSGVIVPLDEVPDAVFAQRLVGDGVSIDPLSQQLLSPCAASVIQVHRAGHALTLAAAGLEIMMHVGLDTVNLNGQGFKPLVKVGDQVGVGDPLITFDADYVARHARSLLTQIIVTNMEQVSALQRSDGKVIGGMSVLLQIVRGQAAAPAPAEPAQQVVESGPICVGSETGLHARPAALLAAAARTFTADVRLVKGGREANARSVVSIMALEVSRGDMVTVVARGEDAPAASAEIARLLQSDLDLTTKATPDAARDIRFVAPAEQPAARAARAQTATADVLDGVAAAPGVAIGRVFQLRQADDTEIEERAADPNHERRTLDAAIASAHLQLELLQTRLAAEADTERAAIFGAHQELLEDPELLDTAAAAIRAGATAAYAWRQAYRIQAERLLSLRNPLLAGRAADLRDVGRRVLHLLVGSSEEAHDFPAESIVIAEDLAPSDVASLDRTRVRGFCTTMGSPTSHVAILAHGLGIPAVTGIDPAALEVAPGTRVVLDGDVGTLQLTPTRADEARIARRQESAARQHAQELAHAAEPAITRDGQRVEVVANIGEEADAERVLEVGGEGVGLLRSEFLFMERRTPPTEDEQARVYEVIARALGPKRILVIRTLDVGGDKPLPYLPANAEPNPFLGERGIRFSLNSPELLRAQVRAILRASAAGRVAIMFPMISTLAEWRAARAVVEEERGRLGVTPVQVGIMVETASAALLAPRFAAEADFFSIGTNDLTQYTLAMDRSNPRLAPQLDALHPAVLRLIEHTVAGARTHDRWVGVCGALAGDPTAVPVLLGLGVDELSVDVPNVPAVKARIRGLTLEECRVTAQLALTAGDAAEVRALVTQRHG